MTESAPEPTLMATENLLTYYNFQDESQSQAQLLDQWLHAYPERWVRLALIEALYQGRYKSISVELLLQLWQRRGQPIYHFSGEFEALVCHNVPKSFASLNSVSQSATDMPKQEWGTPGLPLEASAQAKPGSMAVKSNEAERPSSETSQPEVTLLSETPGPVFLLSRTLTQRSERLQQFVPKSTEELVSQSPEAVTLTFEDGLDDQGDWLTADLEQAALENVQALMQTTAQRTDAAASPIHHFMPTVQPTGLYSRLAAIANTTSYR